MELDNTEKRSLPVSSDRQIRIHPKRPVFAFFGDFVLAEGLGTGAGHHRKAASQQFISGLCPTTYFFFSEGHILAWFSTFSLLPFL
jgi:hypothetical protein